jgi:hypothetical protein
MFESIGLEQQGDPQDFCQALKTRARSYKLQVGKSQLRREAMTCDFDPTLPVGSLTRAGP